MAVHVRCVHVQIEVNEWMQESLHVCTNEWIDVQMQTFYADPITGTNLKKKKKEKKKKQAADTVLLGVSSFWALEHHLRESCFAFLREKAPRAEFGFWMNVSFFSYSFPLSNILAAGFEMPLQLQIDSSGFLRFSYLSFSIKLEGEKNSGSHARLLGPWKKK